MTARAVHIDEELEGAARVAGFGVHSNDGLVGDDGWFGHLVEQFGGVVEMGAEGVCGGEEGEEMGGEEAGGGDVGVQLLGGGKGFGGGGAAVQQGLALWRGVGE